MNSIQPSLFDLAPAGPPPHLTLPPLNLPRPMAPTRSAPLEDFGQKLHGARKDTWTSYREQCSAALPAEDAALTLTGAFPEPDYELALSKGISVNSLALFRALRDSIEAKPKREWYLRRWAATVRTLRPLAMRALNGDIVTLEEVPSANRDRIKLYVRLGYPLFTHAKDWEISVGSFSCWKGQKYSPSRVGTYASLNGRFTDLILWSGSTVEQEEAFYHGIREAIEKQTAKPKAGISFSLFRDRITNAVFIGKKAVSGVVRLKEGFDEVKHARAWMAEHQAELEAQWERLREEPDYRRSINAPRQGPVRRPADATPEQFSRTFAFRGVQFGNWVEGDRRQVDLNSAFDGLWDLAEALGVTTQALSLGGKLGLAFGARGKGGKRAAAAHYEPGSVVINLTKTSGAGCLAHEWWHGFDHYLGQRLGTRTYAIESCHKLTNPGGLLGDVWSACRAIQRALDTGGFAERSEKLDQARSKPYYATLTEKSARAFERYLVDVLRERGVVNDYLANLNLDDDALPTADEMRVFTPAYHQLWSAIRAHQTLTP
jgi:hypothetical protein